jgi:hypothetical protein
MNFSHLNMLGGSIRLSGEDGNKKNPTAITADEAIKNAWVKFQ